MEDKSLMALSDGHIETLQQQAQPKTQVSNIPVKFLNDEELAAIETAMLQAQSIHAEELLPGIPNEITMDYIVPKLSWKDFFTLSTVSCYWKHIIRSRQVYDARVRSQSRETLVLMNLFSYKNHSKIVLYSVRENMFLTLNIPHPDGGFPQSCQCVILDGKLYVLGGWVLVFWEKGDPLRFGSTAVRVLDLAGQGPWRNCARMQKGRAQFGCGVIDGRIYVFGGADHENPVLGSEVYEPKNDTWSPISTMKTFRIEHRVATVGEELVVHGGYDPVGFYWGGMEMVDFEYFRGRHDYLQSVDSLEIYNPVKDEWRFVHHECLRGRTPFMAKGKLFSLTEDTIYIHESDRETWSEQWQSCSFAKIRRAASVDIEVVPKIFVAVDDELLAVVLLSRAYPKAFSHLTLFQTKGFGKDNEGIVWHQSHVSLRTHDHHFMCPIQL